MRNKQMAACPCFAAGSAQVRIVCWMLPIRYDSLACTCAHTAIQLAPLLAACPGNETLVGQYESMKAFTMPKLFRVVEVCVTF